MKHCTLFEILGTYCALNNKSLLFYEIKYSDQQERQKIVDYYDGKIDDDIFEALKNDDQNFIIFSDRETALDYADHSFPTKRIIKSSTNDMSLYIFSCVFDNTGQYSWDNTLE